MYVLCSLGAVRLSQAVHAAHTHLDVAGEHESDVVSVQDPLRVPGEGEPGVPAAHRVLVDEVVEEHAVLVHDLGRGVCVRTPVWQSQELVIAIETEEIN